MRRTVDRRGPRWPINHGHPVLARLRLEARHSFAADDHDDVIDLSAGIGGFFTTLADQLDIDEHRSR